MSNAFLELWWLLKHRRGWRDVQRTMSHPRLGELRYVGQRTRPGGYVNGIWKVQPAGFERAFGVDFPTDGNEPTPEGLALLEDFLADPARLDDLFERARPLIREEYEAYVQEPMPHAWRDSFQLDHIVLPDPDEKQPEWQIVYWCETALHWFTVDFKGDTADYVHIDG